MKPDFMEQAIRLSVENVDANSGGPFGAVIIKNGEIIANGANRVAEANDPTAHAEIIAIRTACKKLNTYNLQGCEFYCSCEPCPMCLRAIYWARMDRIWFATTKEDATGYHFDDQFIYNEINKPYSERKLATKQIMKEKALEAFRLWQKSENKQLY